MQISSHSEKTAFYYFLRIVWSMEKLISANFLKIVYLFKSGTQNRMMMHKIKFSRSKK